MKTLYTLRAANLYIALDLVSDLVSNGMLLMPKATLREQSRYAPEALMRSHKRLAFGETLPRLWD